MTFYLGISEEKEKKMSFDIKKEENQNVLLLFLIIASCVVSFLFSTTDDIKIYIIAFDFILSCFFLARKNIKNELIIIFFLIVNYYIYALPLNVALGLLDFEDLKNLTEFSANGLELPEDFYLYILLLILFKNIVMIFLVSKFEKHQIITDDLTSKHMVFAILGFYILFTLLEAATGHAFFSFTKRPLITCLWISLLWMLLKAFKNSNFFLHLLVFMFVGMISFYFTRSRNIIVVILLFFTVLNRRDYGISLIKTVSFLLLTFLMVFVYGGLRDDGDIRDLVQTDHGIDALGESGLVELVGAHLIGLKLRDDLPDELQDSFVNKLKMLIPLIPKDKPLADKYAGYFFPEVASLGGGYGYSLIAELFLFGGVFAIVIYGCVLGFLFRTIFIKTESAAIHIMYLFMFLRIIRTEISATLMIFVIGLITVLILKKAVTVINQIKGKKLLQLEIN